jgi:SSS family solute:Na+ symporter
MKPNAQGTWESAINATTGKPASAPMAIAERKAATDATGQAFELVSGRAPSIVYAKGQADEIMPTFISAAMPRWFGLLFFMTLLSAAMSTLSSQFHTIGTSAGRDLYERVTGAAQPSLVVVRVAIVLGLIVAVLIAYNVRQEYVIARFTAIFFGLCAATFLPAYVGGLFSRRVTRAGALASMIVGATASLFWLLLVKAREAGAIGLVQLVTGGKTSILADAPNWPSVDPIVVALPLAVLTLVVVSAFTQKPDAAHLARCFPERKGR